MARGLDSLEAVPSPLGKFDGKLALANHRGTSRPMGKVPGSFPGRLDRRHGIDDGQPGEQGFGLVGPLAAHMPAQNEALRQLEHLPKELVRAATDPKVHQEPVVCTALIIRRLRRWRLIRVSAAFTSTNSL